MRKIYKVQKNGYTVKVTRHEYNEIKQAEKQKRLAEQSDVAKPASKKKPQAKKAKKQKSKAKKKNTTKPTSSINLDELLKGMPEDE